MSEVGAWLVVVLAVAAANAPFLTNRFFLFLPRSKEKSFGVRLLEIGAAYALVGGVAYLIETSAFGSAYSQRWEFFALTICLFLVFAFPGFVFRYLWRGKAA